MAARDNMGISLLHSAVGRSVGTKPRSATTEPNTINGFVHKSYETAVKVCQTRSQWVRIEAAARPFVVGSQLFLPLNETTSAPVARSPQYAP